MQPQILVEEEYIPEGYPRPVREIGWNREGPAMARPGIAWGRQKDVPEGFSLPETPAGPRWVVARPPAKGGLRGDEWWESGGEGR